MIDLLRECRAFKECTDQELAETAKICQKVSLKSGERVFEAKSSADYLFVVSEGTLELRFGVTHYHASKEITLDRKSQGDAFGWSALAEPNIYTASAVATEDSELLRIKANDIEKLCKENNHFGYILMKNISGIIGERLASMQMMLMDLIQQDLIEKEH